MNKLLLLLFFLCSIISNAQDKITFSYDNAGNQTNRTLCLNCTDPTKKSAIPKEVAALKEEDLQKFFSEDVISYYPNPVKEELYLKWELRQDNFISTIQVFDFNGRKLTSYSNLDKINNQTIPFNNYPSGVYVIALTYSNGEQKNIKIIKK